DGEIRNLHVDGSTRRTVRRMRERIAPAGASGRDFSAGDCTAGRSSVSTESQGEAQESRARRFSRHRELSLAVRANRMTMKTLRLIALLALGAVPACKSPTPPPPPPGAPVVDAGQNGSVQVGSTFGLSATFTDTMSGAAPWNYDVNWGDGTTASGTKSSVSPITGTHAYAAEGDYHVTVSVTNSLNVTGTDGLTVDATAPVIIAAGDIGDCTRTSDEATGALLDTIPGTVMPLGDNAYLSGTPTEYATCYDPAWGRVKNRTRPVPGHHDYYNPG